MRSTATERSCSACAFESVRRPVRPAGRSVWKGKTRATLLVTGTIVTTPRPRRAATALARSLLTSTAGRRLFASLPRTGSRSTSRISPRRIGHAVRGCRLPRRLLTGGLPLLPRSGVVMLEIGLPQQPQCVLDDRRPALETRGAGVLVQEGDLVLGQADTQLHTAMLPR